MAKENETAKPASGQSPGVQAMAAARAAKGGNRATTSHLGADAKYALRLLAQARSGAKIVSDQIRAGRPPNPAVVQAASVLAGQAASAMSQ